MNSDQLNKLFDTLNEKFFNGELPKITIEELTENTTCKMTGVKIEDNVMGVYYHLYKLIRIRKDELQNMVEVLLHEMIHVQNATIEVGTDTRSHNTSFFKECRRIFTESGCLFNPTTYGIPSDVLMSYQCRYIASKVSGFVKR